MFTIAALSLCMLAVPCWAMNKSDSADTAAKAIVTDADDSSSSSSSESSESSDDEVSPAPAPNKKSKTFFVHIANPSAANFYKGIVQKYNSSIAEWKRDQLKNGRLTANEAFLAKSKEAQKLCRVMNRGIKKFGATQGFVMDFEHEGELVVLTMSEEQSVQEVTQEFKKAKYVYRIFSDKSDLSNYTAGLEATRSSNAQNAPSLAQLIAMLQSERGEGSEFGVIHGICSCGSNHGSTAQAAAASSLSMRERLAAFRNGLRSTTDNSSQSSGMAGLLNDLRNLGLNVEQVQFTANADDGAL